jgi:hypothetical protein
MSKTKNKFRKIFENTITNERHLGDDIQNIHNVGNGEFIIEYEPEVTQ